MKISKPNDLSLYQTALMQQLQFKSQIQYTEKETGDKTEQAAFLVLEWDGEDGLSGESCGHDDGLLQHVEQVTQDHQLAQAHVDGKLENESIQRL